MALTAQQQQRLAKVIVFRTSTMPDQVGSLAKAVVDALVTPNVVKNTLRTWVQDARTADQARQAALPGEHAAADAVRTAENAALTTDVADLTALDTAITTL